MSVFIFFFKQKTAYEMRISDWSSDVCSSDLLAGRDDDAGKRAHCMIIAPLPGSGLLQQFGRFGIRRNAIFDIRLVAQAAQPDVVFLGGLARADGGARARALLLVGDVAFAAVQQLRHMPAELRAARLGDLVPIGKAPCRERVCQSE